MWDNNGGKKIGVINQNSLVIFVGYSSIGDGWYSCITALGIGEIVAWRCKKL
jgi:hypothetical protein